VGGWGVAAEQAVYVPGGECAGGFALIFQYSGWRGREGDIAPIQEQFVADGAAGVIYRTQPADLYATGQCGRRFILGRAVIVGETDSRFDDGGKRVIIGARGVGTGAAGNVIRGATAIVHLPSVAGVDVAGAMRRLPEQIGHRALDEGPPFVAVLFIELQTGREWVGFAVAKDFAIWADAHDARAAGTDGHAAGGLAEFGVAVRRETYGDAFGIEVAI